MRSVGFGFLHNAVPAEAPCSVQPRAPNAEIALVKLADSQNPILLSKGDPGSKWGHLLSHDGKYVAYPAERERGSSILMLDVSEVLKGATASR